MQNVILRRNTCRGCDGKELDLFFSLAPTPIGDAYVTADKLNVSQPSYPIDLYMCRSCGMAQLIDVINPDVLYGEYIYVTASSTGLSEHFQGYADSVTNRCQLVPGSLVVDLGSNDGTLLRCFQKLGMAVVGVEPASHIAAHATSMGIPSISKYFTPSLAKEMVNEHGHAGLITANNVFANIDDLMSWVRAVDILLATDGIFVFESYYLADLLENTVFDFIYHEHLSSFSVRPMQALFQRVRLNLIAVERVSTKGGSLRYFVQRAGGPLSDDGTVANMLAFEDRIGLYRKETFVAYAVKIQELKAQTLDFLISAKRDGKSIAGFGASITCTTLIYHFDIGKYLDYLVDDNPAKQDRFSPGIHLPVLPSSALSERKPDYVIILAWRFADTIIKKNQNYSRHGGKFIIPVPEFKICTAKDL
jgi:hypothetical protein